MRRLKLQVRYEDGGEVIIKTVTLPIPREKEEQLFNFESDVSSNFDSHLEISIMSSNVEVVSWNEFDDIPSEKIQEISLIVNPGTRIINSPKLLNDTEFVIVFCPDSMGEYVESGQFRSVFNNIRNKFEFMFWNNGELIVYYKDGKTKRFSV